MNIKLPTVKIKTEAQSREINTKQGKREVFFQQVQVETDQFRVNVDMDIDGPKDAYRVGETYHWDCIADLVPGQYSSIDLARRMTLLPITAADKKAA